MVDDPLLKVFDGSRGEEIAVGDEVSAVEAVEEEAPEVFEVPEEVEETPVPEEEVAEKKAVAKKTTRRKRAKKKSDKLLAEGEVLTGSEIIASRTCTIDDIREACTRGEIVSVYETCCESGTSQFKYKLV
jgi:hypothetical protein